MGLMDNLKSKLKVDFSKVKDFINECCEEDRKRGQEAIKKD